MRILPDSNIVIATIFEQHEAHQQCLSWLKRIQRHEIEGFFSAHSLAEIYSTLTKKTTINLPPDEVMLYLKEDILPFFSVVELNSEEYQSVLTHMAQENLSGPIVYDALIAYAAQKVKADYVVTLNSKHFKRVYPAFADKIIEP